MLGGYIGQFSGKLIVTGYMPFQYRVPFFPLTQTIHKSDLEMPSGQHSITSRCGLYLRGSNQLQILCIRSFIIQFFNYICFQNWQFKFVLDQVIFFFYLFIKEQISYIIISIYPKMNKQQTFTQLLKRVKTKLLKGTSGSRNYLNQSYQEYQFKNVQNFSDRLITGLQFINTKNQISSQCFNKILKNATKFATSLLSLSFDIAQLLSETKNINLRHENHSSQICMLALYLRYYFTDKKIRIISTSTNKRTWQKYLIDQTKSDSQAQLKSLFQQTKIEFSLFDDAYKIEQNEDSKNQIHLVDLFNVQPTVYRPYLLKNKNKFNGYSNTVLYYSHVQDTQVDEILSQFQQEFIPVEGSPSYPIQTTFQDKQINVRKFLIDFLKQDANHPQKQDIIIFYRSDHAKTTSSKKYSMKLKELLSQQLVQSHVQLITEPRQTLLSGKNIIFIAENAQQLIQWNYSYSNVFYVFDYGWQKTFRFDHQNYCFNQGLFRCNLVQKAKRMSFVGMSKVGKYLFKQTKFRQTLSYLDQAKQIMTYCLRMIQLNLSQYLQLENARLKTCVQILIKLNVIKQTEQNKFQIIDKDTTQLVYKGIQPSSVRLIQQCLKKQQKQQKKTLTNLMISAICILNEKGNLRQSRQNIDSKTIIKPSGVWCRSGYLHSCLQILTKAEIIQNKEQTGRSMSRRKTSKYNENQYEAYGNLFETIIPKRVQFEDMEKIQDLIREYYVNQKIFSEIREQIDQYRELFQVQRTNIKLDKEMTNKLLQIIASHQKNSIAIFSGSRRVGYTAKHFKSNIFPHRNSLIAQLNETPQFIYIIRCFEQENKKQIYMCNTFSHQLYFGVFGQLPPKRSDSLAEHQIQFHGISSATFKGLFRNNGNEMKKFQEQNKCYIEPNEEMATITIYCSKQNGELIKEKFEQFIGKVKEKLICYNKVINYMGNTNLVVSNGGSIKEVVKDNYINKCILSNLDVDVQKEDLDELFDQFFVLKDIEVQNPEQNKHSKQAIIHFNSQKDYYRFHSYYNECKYMNRILEVKPVISQQKKGIQAEKYIEFKWYVWKSHNKGMVQYFTQQDAEKAWVTFFNNPKFDQKKVDVEHKGTKVFINDLPSTTDEIFLERGFAGYGKIKNVQILKTPLKEIPNQQSLLQVHIRSALGINNNENHYIIKNIQKKKSGLRSCIVHVPDVGNINTLIAKLNGVKNVMGQGRLYADSWFTQPILVAYPSFKTLYLQLLEQTLAQQAQRPNIVSNLVDIGNNRLYIVLKSPLQPTLQYITNKFQQKLDPSPIQLTELQSIVILSDIGIANIIDLEQKFNCKLIVNSMKKILTVMCRNQVLKKLKSEIKFRVKQKFFYRISLNTRAFKHFKQNNQKLQEIKKNCFLTELQLQEFSKTLIFEGSAHHVQNALNVMMHLIQSLTVPEEELINTDSCLICCEQITRPYRLQNCGHKFCFGCLDQAINSALGDMSLFPIKCPHCLVQLVIDDLQSLVDPGSWLKLINMAANQFVGKHADVMTFCYTPGCKQINMMKLNNFRCDVCGVSFCCQCKQNWHQGLTCQQAKLGGDTLFKKYMLQNGVRECPNKSCKMPIVRLDGCFRVTCSRCNKSMCFKCDHDKMKAYDDYNECYKHLNDVHGGYW